MAEAAERTLKVGDAGQETLSDQFNEGISRNKKQRLHYKELQSASRTRLQKTQQKGMQRSSSGDQIATFEST
jgi:hypothetical protein